MPEGKRLYVEIKTGPATVEPLVALLRHHPKRERVAFLSFDADAIVATRRSLPACRCFWLREFANDTACRPEVLDELVAFAADAGLDGVDSSPILPDGLLPRLAARGLEAVVWTVNDPELAVALAAKGVLGITTDDPDAIRAALARRAPGA
jgi:glycerophosphoryl diester phosphodiesterase